MSESEIAEGWQKLSLGDLGDFSTSSVDKKWAPLETPVKLVNYMDVYRHDTIDRRLRLMDVTATRAESLRSQVCVGDVLFTPSSETPDDIGHSAVVTEVLTDILHSYHTVRLRPRDLSPLDVRFLGRMANHPSTLRHFRERATGSTRYTLSLGDFRSAPIFLPPLPEQRRIAKILDTVDEAIQRTEELIAKLEETKNGLLHDLLTRGIDENGELRDPERNPEQFKDSALGRIPSDWSVSSVSEVGDVCTGTTPSTANSNNYGGSILFVTPGDMGKARWVDATEKTLSLTGARSAKLLPPKAVLVTAIGVLGRVGQLREKGATNQQIHAIVPQDGMKEEFVFYAATVLGPQMERAAGRQVIPIVNKSRFQRLWMPRPSGPEQDRICVLLEAASDRIAREHRVRSKLSTLKQGLMNDLLTGRVRVSVPEPEEATA